MRLRPIRPEDAPALTQLYDRLSPESAYQRFFTVMRRLPPDWARILAGVDHDRNAAIVAAGSDGGLVGVARYGTLPGADEAEIALVVEDGWQHRGLGTILLSALLDHAENRGITRFLAYVLADNQRMLRLIGRLGGVTERSLDQGVVTLRFTRLPDRDPQPTEPAPGPRERPLMADFSAMRRRMIDTQLVARGIRHPAVLRAMAAVPRERFVPELDAPDAYGDSALPIGCAQTISQPYIVALMLEAIAPEPPELMDRVLEIGMGSGYATAVLAEMAAEVYTVERLAMLAAAARARLADLHYRNVHVREGDGTLGWPEHAPYDGIVVTAGGPDVPAPLLPQLRVGGHLVVPVGSTPRSQELVRVTRRTTDEYTRESLGAVAFVPLSGDAGWPDPGRSAWG